MLSRLLGWARPEEEGSITLCDSSTGEQHRFFLSSDGRLNVATVMAALGSPAAVMFKCKDGVFAALDKQPNGMSLNKFQPGENIVIRRVRNPPLYYEDEDWYDEDDDGGEIEVRKDEDWDDESQVQEGNRYKSVVIDVDTLILPICAEFVSEMMDALHLRNWTDLFTWDEIKGQKQKWDGHPLLKLPSSCFSNEWRARYDHASEQYKLHMQELTKWLLGEEGDGGGFRWLEAEAKDGLERLLTYAFKVSSGSDEVLSKRGVAAAVFSVSIYKAFTLQAVHRGHLEYVLWAAATKLPFVHLVTDMQSRGVAFMCKGKQEQQPVVVKICLQNLSQVQEFVETFGRSILPSIDRQQGEHFLKPTRFFLP